MFGNQLIPPNAQVKKATVFLNPAACKGYFSLWLTVFGFSKSKRQDLHRGRWLDCVGVEWLGPTRYSHRRYSQSGSNYHELMFSKHQGLVSAWECSSGNVFLLCIIVLGCHHRQRCTEMTKSTVGSGGQCVLSKEGNLKLFLEETVHYSQMRVWSIGQ